jgi:uncharacterized protein YtpQ (UPF0354 family)
MISRFIRRFKSSNEDEQRSLQSRVLAILADIYPDKSFSRTTDPLTINLSDRTLGLTNVQANFLLSSQSDSDLREIVREHFDNVFAGLDQLDQIDREDLDWEAARALLMPQLTPVDFLDRVPLISFPFGEDVVLGFVIDSEKAYSYVSETEAGRWCVPELEIYDTALDNLKRRSNEISATAFPEPNGFVVINTMDGFDAVRIVSQGMREFVGEMLGFPFYFGVPNRDFLICWTRNEDQEFQDQMSSQVSRDFDEQPYPLSRFVFEASDDGEFSQVEQHPGDERAAVAENN